MLRGVFAPKHLYKATSETLRSLTPALADGARESAPSGQHDGGFGLSIIHGHEEIVGWHFCQLQRLEQAE